MQNQPLTILVTRPQGQAQELETLLRARGWNVLFQPVIAIGPPADSYAALDAELHRLVEFEWVVFSSANGVEAFRNRLLAYDLWPPKTLKFASIGPGTSRALEEAGLPTDFVPEIYRAENLAEGLVPDAKNGARFLLIRASRGREVLAETLRETGGSVTQAVAYTSEDVTRDSPLWDSEIWSKMEKSQIDWVTITSSAIAASAVRLFGDALKKTKLVSISPLTSAALSRLGFPPQAEAEEATMDGVAKAIELCN